MKYEFDSLDFYAQPVNALHKATDFFRQLFLMALLCIYCHVWPCKHIVGFSKDKLVLGTDHTSNPRLMTTAETLTHTGG